jgi:PTH1 family peptidyl-tRNA hydrolase
MKPTTYMNRSGLALRPLLEDPGFDAAEDLLVVVDDAALNVGRVRFRAEGSPGGHNGLKSISGALQSNAYARLRIGVGKKPDGADLSDWVLAPMPDEDEDVVVGLLPDMTEAVEVWLAEGVEPAMNRFNR